MIQILPAFLLNRLMFLNSPGAVCFQSVAREGIQKEVLVFQSSYPAIELDIFKMTHFLLHDFWWLYTKAYIMSIPMFFFLAMLVAIQSLS